jgi:hypothetical protein
MTAPGDPLTRALAGAAAGRPQPLYDLLARGSRLPGMRANAELADAFALACRALGPKGEAVALAMARLPADHAPGATALEFLPVCGLYALAARASTDASARLSAVAELHTHADDLRFRVREAVIEGLARIGASAGSALAEQVAPWMDGYFHAAAVVTALGTPSWLTAIHEPDAVIARLDDAFALARDAPRSAARWPGHKALLEALGTAPPRVAARFGVPVFDMLVRWAAAKDPALREVVDRSLAPRSLAGRYGPELARVRAALQASKAPARNPDHDFGPSRDRSGNRKRGRRS